MSTLLRHRIAASRALGCVAAAALLCIGSVPASAQQALSASIGLRSIYDDNFLQYSDNQLADFAAGSHPQRYAVDNTGDAILQPSLALTWELDRGGGRRHALRLRGDGDFHSRSGTADYRAAGLRWTETFRHERRFSMGYYRLDDYYVRQLRDEDLPPTLGDLRYLRAQFDLQIASASWRQPLTRATSVAFGYQYEDRRYVPEFRERDSGTHQGELAVDWDRLPRRGAVGLRAAYRWSKARGTDGTEANGMLDADDVSYHGIDAGIGARMEFKRGGNWRLGGDLSCGLATRVYDSMRPTDPYHYGRNDLLNAAEVGLRVGYRPHWALRGFYRFEHNRAHLGTSAPPTSDSGSYDDNQGGVSIEWNGVLWRQTYAGGE